MASYSLYSAIPSFHLFLPCISLDRYRSTDIMDTDNTTAQHPDN